MKIFTLIIAIFFIAYGVYAQSLVKSGIQMMPAPELLSAKVSYYSSAEYEQVKGGGDTIWAEDFEGGEVPQEFTLYEDSGNDWHWQWSDAGPTGPWSDYYGPINSTSAANGFMLYDGDAFSTVNNPKMAYFEIPVLDLGQYSSVVLKFEENMRYCCSGNGGFYVDISTNMFQTQTSFEVSKGLNENVHSDNPVIVELNITDIVAGQNNVGIRFRFADNAYYYWMIDDILLKTAYDNELVLLQNHLEFTVPADYPDYYESTPTQGFYSEIPMRHVDGNSVTFGANIYNNGVNDQNDVVLSVDITDDFSASVYSETSVPLTVNSMDEDSLEISSVPFYPSSTDTLTYEIAMAIQQADTDDNPGNNTTESIVTSVTPGRFSRATVINSGATPQLFANWGDGDGIGTWYYMNNVDTVLSMTFYITSGSDPGVTLIGKLYKWDQEMGNMEILTTDEYIVSDEDPGTWVTVPFVTYGEGEEILEENTWYMPFVQMYFSGNNLWIGADKNLFHYFPMGGGVMLGGDLYWIPSCVPAISLDMTPTVISGIDDISERTGIKIYPNPANDFINIINAGNSQVNIYNLFGKRVKSEISHNDKLNMNISGLHSGMYIIEISDEETVYTKKILISK